MTVCMHISKEQGTETLGCQDLTPSDSSIQMLRTGFLPQTHSKVCEMIQVKQSGMERERKREELGRGRVRGETQEPIWAMHQIEIAPH